MSNSERSERESHLLCELLQLQQQLAIRQLEKLETRPAASRDEPAGNKVVEPSSAAPSRPAMGGVLANFAAISAIIGLASYAILTYTLGRIAPAGVRATDFGGGYVGLLERFPLAIAFIVLLFLPLILFVHNKGLLIFWCIVLGIVLYVPLDVPSEWRAPYRSVVAARVDFVQAMEDLPPKLEKTRHLIEIGRRPDPIDFMGFPVLDPGVSIVRMAWSSAPTTSAAKTVEVFGSECVMLLGQSSDGSAVIYGPRKGLSATIAGDTAEILRTNSASIESC